MSRRAALLAAAVAVAVIAPAAFAGSIATGSAHLGARTIAVPLLYPNSLTLANRSSGGNVGKVESGDTLTVVLSEELQASSFCAGLATAVGAVSGPVTVRLTNNSGTGGFDVLSVDPVASTTCSDTVLHFGSINLGSAGYVTSASATFTNSTMTLTQTSSSATIAIVLGSPSGTLAKVSSGLAAMYTPDPVVTDTSARSVGVNTAVSGTSVQF